MSDAAAIPDWDGILDEGEMILWQGRPEPGLSLAPVRLTQIGTGLFMTAFAVFWTATAFRAAWSASGGSWFFRYFFPLFGLVFVAAGLHTAGGYALTRAFSRHHTFYTLTDRRAFIATNLPWQGKRLKSYPISATTALDFDGADPGSLWFAEELRRNGRRSRTVPIGFERLADAAKVYRLMRDIQGNSTT